MTRSSFAATLMVLAMALSGCSQKTASIARDDAAANPPDDPNAASLYDLPVKLTDQNGAALRLEDLRGHPVLITMFYGTCPLACPMLISDVKAIERDMDPATRDALRVVLVSIDPARDTTEALKELAVKHKVDERRWRFTSASDADVRALAAALGIKYRRIPGGGYNHSSLITLLDARGAAVARVEGLQQPTDGLRARAKLVTARR